MPLAALFPFLDRRKRAHEHRVPLVDRRRAENLISPRVPSSQ